MTDWSLSTIAETAPAIQARRLSPVELTRSALERIDWLEPRLRSFITLFPEEALAAARVAEAEIARGDYRGSLHGIPVSLKDNLALAGWPTTNGSKLAENYTTDYDATVVRRFREAGAIICGKNNMHEWALGGTSWGGHFGSVRNPWNEACIAGGSSGGSAVAVSTGMVFASVGTDGMGSIRMPAALCGVVGLKPTYGLVSRFGELPPTSSQMDHVGPMTRTVRDAALVLNAVAGFDPLDPTSRRLEQQDFARYVGDGIAGTRVGLPTSYFFDEVDPEVDAAVQNSLAVLKDLGATVRPVTIPSAAYAYKAFALIRPESLSYHQQHLATRRHDYADREIGRRLIALQFLLSRHSQLALQARNLIRREFMETMQAVDVLVAPTTPIPAFPGDADTVAAGQDQVTMTRPLGQHRLLTRLTVPFNFTGMPTISVPCGFAEDGLPIGLQIAGRLGEDARVLQVAAAFEQSRGLGYAIPPIVPSPG